MRKKITNRGAWKREKRRKAKRVHKSSGDWSRWSVPVLAIVLVGAWYIGWPDEDPEDWVTVGTQFGTCGERGRPYHCVTDGDTVTIGFGQGARRIRLKGFDAPEIDGRCGAESAQAVLAQRALMDWLNNGPFEWDGGASPPRDRYGRELREARRIGADGSEEALSTYMISEGLAEGDAFWEQRNWCG